MNKGSIDKRRVKRWLLCLAIAYSLLAGCASTQPPVEQVRYFSQAFVAVNMVGQPLLDDLAVAERAVGQRVAVRRAKSTPAAGAVCTSQDAPWTVAASDNKLGFIDGFCLEDVSYFADIGDPRATAQLRGGLRVIERYADVLSAMVEGRNLEQALGQVDALSQEVGGLLAIAGAQVALVPALTALRPLLVDVAKQANAQEARRLILEGAPAVSDLIQALRRAVPAMFTTLIADARRGLDVADTAQAAVKEVQARRLVVSQYVVLLDRLQDAWDSTVAAAQNPSGARLADLVERTAELSADAVAVRKSLVALRNNVAPAP